MHPESIVQAATFAAELDKAASLRIADIGSHDINGSYRFLFTGPSWHYVGIDREPGKNVDHVTPNPYVLWPEEEFFDVVVCGQVLEHVEMPWEMIQAIARIMKHGAVCWLSAPNTWEYHEHPKDCWRIWPDGMRALLRWGGLVERRCYVNGQDTIAIARKP